MLKRFISLTALVLLLTAGLNLPAIAQQDGRTWLDEHLADASNDPAAAPIWDFEIVAEYPHDTGAYTQGLIYVDGRLFEGTGQYDGESDIREVELQTGEVIREQPLEDEYFGEGIALIDEHLYQITWQEETAFVYDRDTFQLLDTFTYPGQGWGLTWDGEYLIMSNGSHVITFRDPESFEPVRTIEVISDGQPIASLNELEWIDGEIWANIYRTDWIVRIDPADGEITGWIDLTGLLPDGPSTESAEVLNGIAWDAETGRLFVTGKYWPLLFEIELVERNAG